MILLGHILYDTIGNFLLPLQRLPCHRPGHPRPSSFESQPCRMRFTLADFPTVLFVFAALIFVMKH